MQLRPLLPLLVLASVPALAQNNECAGALPLPLGATPYDTSGATTSAPAWPCALGGSDLWYVFTPPTTGSYTISTCTGTSYDSGLEVFSGPCGALVSLACNDDTCGLQSTVGFLGNAGVAVYVRVGGYNGLTGAGTLTVTQNLPVQNPANGHYYEIVPVSVDWNTADQMARTMSYLGRPGHLVTIADAAEDQFVYFTLAGGPLGNAWLGAYQDMTSPTYTEPLGGWTWVTGEPFVYTNWYAGEPNNGGNQEHYLGYWPNDQWNDYTPTSNNVPRFVVEYEDTTIGTNYCAANNNSTGAPGALRAVGTASVAANDLTLEASGLPNSSFGFFLTSLTQGFTMNPGGSRGNLCVGGAIGRYVGPGQIKNTGTTGGFALRLNLPQTPTPSGFVSVLAGQVRNFQAWHRDVFNGQATSNFTVGLAISFLP